MSSLLENLAQGLRGAGGVMSGDVYQSQVRDAAFLRDLAMRQKAQQLHEAQFAAKIGELQRARQNEERLALEVAPLLSGESPNLASAAAAAAKIPGQFGTATNILNQVEARRANVLKQRELIAQRQSEHEARIREAIARRESQEKIAEMQIEARRDIASFAASLKQPAAPVAVIGPDGKPIFVNRSDAIGKTPFDKAGEQAMVGNEGKIRDDFNKLSTEFIKVRDAHQRVMASANEPSAAGDMALIFNFMKVLDPGSVVRESEFATAAQSGAYGERVKAAVNRVINGQRLSAEVRRDFLDRSERLYRDALQNQIGLENKYKEISKRSGVRPENVVMDYRTSKTGSSSPPPPAGFEEDK